MCRVFVELQAQTVAEFRVTGDVIDVNLKCRKMRKDPRSLEVSIHALGKILNYVIN